MPCRAHLRFLCPLLLAALVPALLAGTPGTFRGTLVEPPSKQSGRWIFVKGRNGMLRKVEISRAKVVYEETVPKSKRENHPELSLKPGIEVRVTAEQDSGGEWRASEVEIVGPDQPEEDPGEPSGEQPGADLRTT